MPISHKRMWEITRKALRADYERRVAADPTKRLPPELEALLFEYRNDVALTMGFAIPVAEVNAKIDELATKAGVTPREFKQRVLDETDKD